MQNMKKLLSAFVALSFVTVAGISTVACNSCNKDKGATASMDGRVLADLGLYDTEGKSQVEAKLTITDATASWSADKLNNIKASGLLTDTNNAKSENSFKFLTDVLKLKAKGDGTWDKKTFEKDKADAISLTTVSVEPTLKAISDDYAISGGIAKIQWKQDKDNLGSQYGINLKTNETTGIIKGSLPGARDLALADFNTTSGVLANFAVGKPKSGVSKGADITTNLKTDSAKGKEVSAIAKAIDQTLKITVTQVTAAGENFAGGDSLKIKISLGSVQFTTEYTLTLPEGGETFH